MRDVAMDILIERFTKQKNSYLRQLAVYEKDGQNPMKINELKSRADELDWVLENIELMMGVGK